MFKDNSIQLRSFGRYLIEAGKCVQSFGDPRRQLRTSCFKTTVEQSQISTPFEAKRARYRRFGESKTLLRRNIVDSQQVQVVRTSRNIFKHKKSRYSSENRRIKRYSRWYETEATFPGDFKFQWDLEVRGSQISTQLFLGVQIGQSTIGDKGNIEGSTQPSKVQILLSVSTYHSILLALTPSIRREHVINSNFSISA